MKGLEGVSVGLNAIPLVTPLTGIGRYTWQLAHELRGLLAEPPQLFYGGDWSTDMRPPPAPQPVTIERRVRRAFPMGFEIARALQQRRFDAGVRALGIGLYHEPNFLAFRFDGPTVVTVHDLSWVRHPETHPRERVRVMNTQMPRVLRECRHVVADSEFTRGEIIAHYGLAPGKVSTVHLGVDAGFRPLGPEQCAPVLERHQLGFGSYVLHVGTLEPRKNLVTAVDAFMRLPQPTRQRYPLVIAGMAGWGRDGVSSRLKALMMSGEARLAGFVPQGEMPALYSGARAFVYPSLYEGFGLPPLESMACGVPAIVSDRACLPEIVGDAGLQVAALDVAALSEALRSLLADDALHERLCIAARLRAKAFTWRRCAEATVAAYCKALAT
ncbi:MAG TPA: glycosyltransferase family 1 protein [Usitatibacter sp.]|nr:glycosyltransferase family 1 protein [Usitatibacter sp.]